MFRLSVLLPVFRLMRPFPTGRYSTLPSPLLAKKKKNSRTTRFTAGLGVNVTNLLAFTLGHSTAQPSRSCSLIMVG